MQKDFRFPETLPSHAICTWKPLPVPIFTSQIIGLLLRNLNSVTILGKPYYLLYIPIMVTEFKYLNSNPDKSSSVLPGSFVGFRPARP